ncbi:MAG: cytochrome c biogenesis heme-transporting ATPase CcmA [Gammaproteobacteria bacterium]|nr:cytochrome c biogenesis heme-transporting ATPase CcmA [Gammaproteobacteria bacterium]
MSHVDGQLSRLTTNRLSLYRGDRCLIKDLCIDISAGHALQITGANGSGKTTLLRTLAGLSRPETGSITWHRGTHATDERPRIAYLGHRNGLKSDLTPREELRFNLRIRGIDDQSNVCSYLERLGLAQCAELHCGQLSAGQQRRVALARVLLSDCPVWILDEPLTALDAQACNGFHELLSQHLQQGGMALIATHQSLQLAAGSLKTMALESPC